MAFALPFRPYLRFTNVEGLTEYDFDYPRRGSRPGVSAMVRVRNEETKIAHSLRSILPVVDEVVVVDNGSGDATLEIVDRVRALHDPSGKIRVFSYPHRVSRYGPEHAGTPESSVHSVVYFYNWCAAHSRFKYTLKWDGDTVLLREARDEFAALLKRIQSGWWTAWTLKGQTIYRGLDGAFFLAKGEVNREVMVFPTGYWCRFRKRDAWEGLKRPPWLRKSHFDPVCFYEVKFTDEDEFAHWSTTDFPGPRKAREWENYHLVQEGKTSPDFFEPLPAATLDEQLD